MMLYMLLNEILRLDDKLYSSTEGIDGDMHGVVELCVQWVSVSHTHVQIDDDRRRVASYATGNTLFSTLYK